MHGEIIEKLYQEYTVRGFISEDHIFDVLEENGVSLFDVEYICDHLLSKGVIIRGEVPVSEDGEEYELEDGDFDWEESAAAEENNEPDTPVFFDDTYSEEGMDIFGEHYADTDEEYDEEDDV